MLEWFLKRLRVGFKEAFVGGMRDGLAELTGESPPLVIDAESSAPGGKTRDRLPSAGNGKTTARKKRRAAVG